MEIQITTPEYTTSAAIIITPNTRGYFWGTKEKAKRGKAEIWYFGHHEIEEVGWPSRQQEKTAVYI